MTEQKKKFIIAVQGEGRGHMTQALSMYDLLTESGHTVAAVVLGSSGTREVPAFFFEKIACPVVQVKSPNFICDKNNKSINITKSVVYNTLKIQQFRKSLRTIDYLVKEHQPDTIINLFDLLTGLYFRFYKPNVKLVCMAHQYIYCHDEFEFPEGRWLDKLAIKFYTRLTASRSSKNLALSFYKIHTHDDEVVIVPPLLRKEIFELQTVRNNFYVVYLVNSGYFSEVLQWHRNHPEMEIHCFTDHPEKLSVQPGYDQNKLFLHRINDKLFLEMMSKSKGLASTAGFESVCEAMYLGKPVLMVPIEGHYEQYCNSRDAHKAGAGIFADRFDLGKLENFVNTYHPENGWFRNWVNSAKLRIYNEILSA